MGIFVVVVIIVLGVLFFRRTLIRIAVGLFLAAIVYSYVTSQVRAGMESAGGIPGQLMAMVHEQIDKFFGEGKKIMQPLIDAAGEPTELYQYCLADNTVTRGRVHPGACQALSGSERTACFEKQVDDLKSIDGVGDMQQIDDLRSKVKEGCAAKFGVRDAMPKLLKAGVRGASELYGACKVPGACEEPDLDSPTYRDCLARKFGELGLVESYCRVFTTPETREQWRKCVEVSMVQQTTGFVDLAQIFDTPSKGAEAIRACRQAEL